MIPRASQSALFLYGIEQTRDRRARFSRRQLQRRTRRTLIARCIDAPPERRTPRAKRRIAILDQRFSDGGRSCACISFCTLRHRLVVQLLTWPRNSARPVSRTPSGAGDAPGEARALRWRGEPCAREYAPVLGGEQAERPFGRVRWAIHCGLRMSQRKPLMQRRLGGMTSPYACALSLSKRPCSPTGFNLLTR